ncbi:redoxin family protein [Leifsonia poae]|uniref:redoxin family protein n=1 Tax=Leifsonia poae TaxID=110933 RepID=UPI003D67B3D2
MADLRIEGRLGSFSGASGWLNSPPLTAEELRGKVVLVDFWTYTCINWLRTLAYVRAWAEKYKDQGLVVIGVHTPEFPFEGDPDNVRRAAKDMTVEYPVALDPDYAVWQAFDNHYWPAVYIADAEGRIRYHHFGEGEYEEGERVIQQLLREAGAENVGHELVAIMPDGLEAQADWSTLGSPETYLGYEQGRNFASPGTAEFDVPFTYSVPTPLGLNEWALDGEWEIDGGAAAVTRAGGRIVYRFHARDVHLVLSPGESGAPVRFRVLIDGQPPGAAHGLDTDEEGNGTVVEPRLYQLVRHPEPVTDRTFEIEFLDPGAAAYVFTFG